MPPHLGDDARTIRHLPSIPSLPPIQMPSPRSFLFDDQPPHTSQTSTPGVSLTSEESFVTALTSSRTPHSAQMALNSTALDSALSQSHITPHSLRKSISVDSFVQHALEETRTSPSHEPKLNNGRDSAIDPDLNRWRAHAPVHADHTMTRRDTLNGHVEKQKLRGINLTLVDDEFDDSPYEYSDADRHNSLETRRNDHRWPRPRAPPPVPAGGLPLAGRSSGYQTDPNRSNVNPDGRYSKPFSPSHGKTSASVSSPSFSKSFGPARKTSEPSINPAKRSHTISINTGLLGTRGMPEYTIAVLGPSSSGKSSFIRKSLKMHQLSEPLPTSAVICAGASSKTVPYVTRTAHVRNSQSDRFIRILELDTKHLVNTSSEATFDAWPAGLPQIDAVVVCYDSSNPATLEHVGKFLRGFDTLRIPSVVLACKSDLVRVTPKKALNVVEHYAGIVEVDNKSDEGLRKMRKCMSHIFRSIAKNRERGWKTGDPYRNPASPTQISSPNTPWDMEASESGTLTLPSSTSITQCTERPDVSQPPLASSSIYVERIRSSESIPNRSSSTGALMLDVTLEQEETHDARTQSNADMEDPGQDGPLSHSIEDDHDEVDYGDGGSVNKQAELMNDARPSRWVTVEQLIEKLFFVAISGDDPAFIKRFFLTYRRFTTPRSVLLGMQKRMIELNGPCSDPMLAAFAQMRTCNLLESWMKEYPGDFAVTGAAGALSAFTKQALAHPHTMHYGSDFLPFLEILPTLADEDSSWSMKPDDISVISDDGDGLEREDSSSNTPATLNGNTDNASTTSFPEPSSQIIETATSRERKPSMPLSARSFLQAPSSAPLPGRQRSQSSTKDILGRLLRTAQQLSNIDSRDIAREITRIDWTNFQKIESRHWLRHTLVSGKKNPEVDPIARFHEFFNHLHTWALSLILCHDKAKARARQMEKFAEIASALRNLNNYSSLRAIVTAISASTFPGDAPMEIFKTKVELYKRYRSFDVLLHSTGAHRSYRLALRNTKRGCIPCLEVHMSDLFRAHEGNQDVKEEDPSQIHWAKFDMIGKFVHSTAEYQMQCRISGDYNFRENTSVADLLRTPPMDEDMIQSRLTPPPDDMMESYSPGAPMMPLSANPQTRESGIRRLFMW